MELRLYQAGQIKRVIRELKERALALLASAVGSGKTTVWQKNVRGHRGRFFSS